jgi:hypothetical protein
VAVHGWRLTSSATSSSAASSSGATADGTHAVLTPKMTNIVIVVVSTVWTANFMAGVILEDYEADQMINTIFMAIVGGALALRRKDDKDAE